MSDSPFPVAYLDKAEDFLVAHFWLARRKERGKYTDILKHYIKNICIIGNVKLALVP